jgi:phosphate starvation-inducible PhoH-like protein
VTDKGFDCGPSYPLRDVIDLGSIGAAQAIYGSLHRHVALIQEAFRDRTAPRGKPAYLVTLHASGAVLTMCGRPGAEREITRARTIIEALVLHYRHRNRVREGEVLAAIAFTERGDAPPPGGLELPQLGGLTLRTPRQLHYVEALRDPGRDLIFGVGPAGTGKTFLAVAVAVEAMRKEEVDRIIVTRPAVEAGERLGFLPGDLTEKVDPYLQPIWDAFRSQIPEADLRVRRDRRQIEVAPLAFMRGRTLANAFVIVDEAQNATRAQMKMVLTRLGEGSRMVVTGDPSQIDLPRADDSGLVQALDLMGEIEGVEVVRFGAQDVVRHRLVGRIIEAYEAHEADARRRRAEAGGAA